MYKFFSETLNHYSGLINLLVILLMVAPLSLKKVRHTISNFFSKKDIHDRLDLQDATLEMFSKSLKTVVTELTQNGGEGGLKNSTMKDNIGLALRGIASAKTTAEQNNKAIEELSYKLGKTNIAVATLSGQVSILAPLSTKS